MRLSPKELSLAATPTSVKKLLARMKSKGECPPRKPLHKVVWSWVGSFLGIFFIAVLGDFFEELQMNHLFLIGSFGASAVLIYGVPLAEYSQPRNLLGGHLFSAFIGVSVYFCIGQHLALASATAVSLAIVVMHLTRTIHPPGGATALIAVLGGDKIHSLGYLYLITPVGIGALVMLVVALLVNNMSRNSKRHYPVYWL